MPVRGGRPAAGTVLPALLGLLVAAAALVLAGEALAQALGQAEKGSPFGIGPAPEPAATGLTGYLLAKQAEFYLALKQAVRAAKTDGHAVWMLAGLSFAYGVFHAAGPGHGKAVISSYLLADGGTLKRGALLSLGAGLVQAASAILLVSIVFVTLRATSTVMTQVVDWVEITAFAGIGLFGLYLAFVKGRRLYAALRGEHVHGPGCGHGHAPDPVLLAPGGDLKRAGIAVLSAGARPCSGAILVLTLALAQGVFLAGIVGVIAMGLGTALMVTVIAALAVYAKRLAVRLAGRETRRADIVLGTVELAAALLVAVFGFALLTGYLESERMGLG